MEKPRVSVVVLNWNGWEDTIECLESLFQINYSNYDVIVVDNNSQDDSAFKIEDYAQNKEFKLIKNDKNYGFAEGNNIGMRYALEYFNPDYILLLNNDTVVDKNFLEELVNNGETDEKIGILGPKIYYYNKTDLIWSAGCKIAWKTARGIHIGINELDKGQYDEKKEVEYVSGSAFLIKTNVIKRIGLMDQEYFLYFEESDWTLRANQAGYKSLYVPKAKIWHKVSQSGGGISKSVGLYYITRNRWIFMRKWAKKNDLYFFTVSQLIGIIIIPIYLSIYYKNLELFKIYYNGIIDGLKFNSKN